MSGVFSSITDKIDDLKTTVTGQKGGKRQSRRQSRKSRRDEVVAARKRNQSHKGGKSRRNGRQSRRTDRK
jgi:hypothetical protein